MNHIVEVVYNELTDSQGCPAYIGKFRTINEARKQALSMVDETVDVYLDGERIA